MAGAATQVFTREFDAVLGRLPSSDAASIVEKITEMGSRLESFPHYRLTGRREFRLRVGSYRIIYSSASSRMKSSSSRLGIDGTFTVSSWAFAF